MVRAVAFAVFLILSACSTGRGVDKAPTKQAEAAACAEKLRVAQAREEETTRVSEDARQRSEEAQTLEAVSEAAARATDAAAATAYAESVLEECGGAF
jgi:hypothetical protein